MYVCMYIDNKINNYQRSIAFIEFRSKALLVGINEPKNLLNIFPKRIIKNCVNDLQIKIKICKGCKNSFIKINNYKISQNLKSRKEAFKKMWIYIRSKKSFRET